MKTLISQPAQCDYKGKVKALHDAMDILQGKWNVLIIATLCCLGPKRFTELQRHLQGIGAKMLTRQLQILEMNQLVKRTVCRTKPVTVQYEITPYGKSLETIVLSIMDWGQQHRKHIMKTTPALSS
ncbi:winged helix-turn-helix transcriptional regulator [Chitinophaga flava]|uniref:Transcriptional regulator n=1 Tax=Chitinophaga flava TaxID=2259036 RepID=A0A365XZT3_9BACT|nr:helix-turn-helix domain-containing protein [Chitinophaga flava]RBL91843.1 transcriptional regulator [Chitinophaga flava]